jgi:CDP-diacylglycerol--glycerol-3-phosphate 3-phosphatidyltransferase
VSVATKNQAAQRVFNVPNQLTALRLVLAIVLFVLIPLAWYRTSIALFLLAAGTDWLDGYYARKYGQVTTLGRILDPFVDKIIICGTFIFLVALYPGSGIAAWMAVVIVGRELLVTALRNFLEGEGADFSAQLSGKLKMALQCGAVIASLYLLIPDETRPDWLFWLRDTLIWSAVVLTIFSGLQYIYRAVQILRAMK